MSSLYPYFMMKPTLLVWLYFLFQAAPTVTSPPPVNQPPREKSAYYAYVGRDYIFTVEVVKPGVPLLNFVSMKDEEGKIWAKDIRLALGNRQAPVKMLAVETGEFQHPMSLASISIHPRSSFGVRLDGEFGDVKELYGVAIRVGDEDFQLVPLSTFDFESLAMKVNHLNLGSPDFREDWRVLKMETMGTRAPLRKRNAVPLD